MAARINNERGCYRSKRSCCVPTGTGISTTREIPICGKRERGNEADRLNQQQPQDNVAFVRMVIGVNIAENNVVHIDERGTSVNRTCAGQAIHRTLEQQNEGRIQTIWAAGGCTKTWKKTCTVLLMTPQCSPFIYDDDGADIEVHKRL